MTHDFTVNDLLRIAAEVHRIAGVRQTYEATFAVLSGWDLSEYQRLYAIYIHSTQVDVATNGNNTTALKGNPLEDVARYFLEQGGVVQSAAPGGLPGRWTTDGVGETYPDRWDLIIGRGTALRCGSVLYLEAKNQNDVMGPADWAQHCQRMSRHDCRCGVVVSTSGFGFDGGRGYAEEIYHDWIRQINHFLLSIADLRKVALDQDFPWAVMRTAYHRAAGQKYRLRDVQDLYSKRSCQSLAVAESARLKSP